MSVRFYPGIPASNVVPPVGTPQYYARFQATFGVKSGARIKMRRVKLSAFSDVGLEDLLLQACRMLEGVDRCSTGQMMGLQMTIGHYVKDEVIPSEPVRSRHAFAIHISPVAKKRIHMLQFPWLKESISDLDVKALVEGVDYSNLCSIWLQEDGKSFSCVPTPDYKHITLKDTEEEPDYLVDYGDSKDDPSDGGVDGKD